MPVGSKCFGVANESTLPCACFLLSYVFFNRLWLTHLCVTCVPGQAVIPYPPLPCRLWEQLAL